MFEARIEYSRRASSCVGALCILLAFTCVQAYVTIVPLDSDPLPEAVTLFAGKVIVWSGPALADGGPGTTGAAFTVTNMTSLAVTPELSVTVSWKVYSPCTSAVTSVVANPDEAIVETDGPLNCTHL